jgi:hypothetical protein
MLGVHQIVCWGTLTYGVTVFGPAMAARAGVSVSAIMAAYALGLLCNGFVAPAATRWVMRGNAWFGGLLGLALGVAACVVLAFGSHLAFVALGFGLAGAAMALAQYDFAWLCVRLYHPHNARRVVTGITLFGAVASSIMWPIAVALQARFGLTAGWLGLGGIMAAVGTLTLWWITRAAVAPSPPDADPAAPEPTIPAAQIGPNSTQTRYVIAGLTTVSTIGGGLASNLPLVLQKFSVEPGVIALVLSLFGIGQLLARGLDFLGSKRAGLGVTLKVAVVACALSWALLLGPGHALVVAGAVLLLGASNGLFTILRGATPQLLFQGEQFTHASASMARMGSFARAFAPLVITLALESGMNRALFAAICAAGIGLGAWWVWQHAQSALR